ncbi:hypothetical protein FQR65_LT19910 [Abscondita terminalis]|nr:hypothetical protein FQR65_LT19910 [Abscondita terminalis]
MMTTVNVINKVNTTFTKGALDELLKRCSKIMIDNKIVDLTENLKKELLDIAQKLSSDALRVLGFAYHLEYDKIKDKNDIENNLIFLGGVAMIDPVRSSAVQAIKEAHDAGIKVVMITGDHAVTALAIAKELNLAFSDYEVISSDQLEKMSDDQLERIVQNIKVFARVNPEHKVKIVELLQKAENITSMTGDGVNDAPSLAKADIGVAMGITGTDVAKQASDVILTDDNFATIIKGVYEVVESILAITMGMGNNDPSLMKQKPIHGKNSIFRGLGLTIGLIIFFTTITNIGSYYIGMEYIDKTLLGEHNNYYEFFQDEKIALSLKQDLSAPGRTAMFLSITVAPRVISGFNGELLDPISNDKTGFGGD